MTAEHSDDHSNLETRYGTPAVFARKPTGSVTRVVTESDNGGWQSPYGVDQSPYGVDQSPYGVDQSPARVDGMPDSRGATIHAATDQTSSSTFSGILRELLETVILTLVIFFLVRTVIQNYRIDGISMEPNFHNGQFLIINKLAYRLGDPQRGDVIVFHYPRDPSRDFIKRVIGLPGEVIEVRQGQVFVGGNPLPEPYKPNPGSYDAAPVTIPPDELFVMGDNRNNSSDSHIWGALPMNDVIGKAVASYWPPDDWAVFSNPVSATP